MARNPHEDVYIQKVNYTDNLYCPPEMKKIAERMKEENYSQWLHVWAGEPVQEGDTKLIGYPRRPAGKTVQAELTMNLYA